MNWLITGGCGFIGRALIARMLKDGDTRIRVLDNLSVGTRAEPGALTQVSETDDPQEQHEGEAPLPGDDPYRSVYKADLLVILTEWNKFRALDLKKLAMPRLVDLRNIHGASAAHRAGFASYAGIGR